MRTLINLLFFVLLIPPALARIGETETECLARYGKISESYDGPRRLIWRRDGIKITATFLKGKCVWLFFRKEAGDFTDAESKLLRSVNSGGQEWTQISWVFSKEWERDDKTTVRQAGKELSFETPEWKAEDQAQARALRAAERAAEEAAAKAKLKGF